MKKLNGCEHAFIYKKNKSHLQPYNWANERSHLTLNKHTNEQTHT
jgi:hypothetical protein